MPELIASEMPSVRQPGEQIALSSEYKEQYNLYCLFLLALISILSLFTDLIRSRRGQACSGIFCPGFGCER